VDLIISLMEYAQSRYSLVLLMVFLLTFTKSCAVISLLIPGTSGLLLFGTLASASVGHFLLMWMSASLGAIGGFWLSWLTGYRYRHHLHRIRWLNAERLARGQLFLRRHGAWAVFLAAFSLRCAPPCRWSPAPAGPLSGSFSSLTSVQVYSGRWSCWRQGR
jgi:membrane protein DedA with SNARE-associated domain